MCRYFSKEGEAMVKEITDAEFEEEVIKSDKPVIVDFWAPWCGPCKMIAPVFEKLSKELTDVKFVKVNVDDNQNSAQEFGVMSIPTLVMVKNGEEAGRVVGALSETQLKDRIKTALE